MWTFPQSQEPHSACVSKAFKSQTLILLHVRAQRPHGSTQSRPVVVLHSNSSPSDALAIIPVCLLFLCLPCQTNLNQIMLFGWGVGRWGGVWQDEFSSKAEMCWA